MILNFIFINLRSLILVLTYNTRSLAFNYKKLTAFIMPTIALNSPNNSGEFTVKANKVSPENKYIQSATLNGKPMSKTWLSHEEIMNGGTLIFEMGPDPNKDWGNNPLDFPPSMKH